MKTISKKIIFVTIMFALVLMPLNNLYADTSNISIDGSKGKDFIGEIFDHANGFSGESDTENAAAEALNETMGEVISGIGGTIFYVGNFIFFMCAIVLGIRYISESSQGKANIKGSLATLFVGAVFFYSAQLVFEFANGAFDEIFADGTAESAIQKTFATFIVIAKYAAYSAVLFMGVKYMMADARDKSKIKSQLLPFAVGVMLVFSSSTLITFIVDASKEIL